MLLLSLFFYGDNQPWIKQKHPVKTALQHSAKTNSFILN